MNSFTSLPEQQPTHAMVSRVRQIMLVLGSAGVAWFGALLGLKFVAALAVAACFVSLLIVTKRRDEVLLLTATVSVALVIRKSLGTLTFVPSGAAGLYVSSLDLVVVMIYGFWLFEGTLWADLKRLWTRRVVQVVILWPVFVLPSFVVAGNAGLAFAELVRMASCTALFIAFAARVRTRRHVQIVLLTLAAVGVVECMIVVAQKATRGPLGLSFLGTPTTMVAGRVTEAGVLDRPFGTINHPVFMGAVLAQIGLLAFAVTLGLRNPRHRLLGLGVAGACGLPLVLSQTRAAALGVGVIAPLLVLWALATKRLEPRLAAVWVAGVVALLVVSLPITVPLYNDNFQTDHFGVEVESRTQLNSLAIEMWGDSPLLGVGLNNFQPASQRYQDPSLIFAGNPVHNVYLLQLSETGIIGTGGFLAAMVAVVILALRLSRSSDRLYSALGAGLVAVIGFFAIEEMLLFALRQESPRTLFWMLAGLGVATDGIAQRASTERVPAVTSAPVDIPVSSGLPVSM